jgi:hypothetical protein
MPYAAAVFSLMSQVTGEAACPTPRLERTLRFQDYADSPMAILGSFLGLHGTEKVVAVGPKACVWVSGYFQGVRLVRTETQSICRI